eukprot:gene3132-3668_t
MTQSQAEYLRRSRVGDVLEQFVRDAARDAPQDLLGYMAGWASQPPDQVRMMVSPGGPLPPVPELVPEPSQPPAVRSASPSTRPLKGDCAWDLEVTLIDREGDKVFRAAYPFLLAGLKTVEQVANSVSSLNTKAIKVVSAEIMDVDVQSKFVRTTLGDIPYDDLVL